MVAPMAQAARLLRVELPPQKLTSANAGVNTEASAQRLAALVLPALRAELGADFDRIEVELGTGGTQVLGHDPNTAASLALAADGIVRALRHCGDWVVYEENEAS